MTRIEHTGSRQGPVILHVDTQAASVEVVSDPRVRGSWIELSTPDESGPAVDAIRAASFRDAGGELHLTLREGASGGGVQFGNGVFQSNNFSGGTVTINGVTMSGGGFGSGPITVRAILQPGSQLVVKTMSGSVTTRGVTAVQAETMSGGIEVDGVTAASRLKSMSGSIRAIGSGAARPAVRASTMSGNVYGQGVRLDGSSMSGRVHQS